MLHLALLNQVTMRPRDLCNIGYLSETHLKSISREIMFIHNMHFSCSIILKFCTKWLGYWAISYAQMIFHEIWVKDQFWTDILNCTGLQLTNRSGMGRSGESCWMWLKCSWDTASATYKWEISKLWEQYHIFQLQNKVNNYSENWIK